MLQISKEERTFVVENHFKRKSDIVQAALKQGFNRATPCKKTIQQNVMKYISRFNRNKENSGNIENSGRWRTARSEENIKLVRNTLESTTNLAWICTEKYGRHVKVKFAEVVPRRCSSKGLFCKYAVNLQEKTHAEG